MEEATAKEIAQNYLIQTYSNAIDNIDLDNPSLSFVSSDKADSYFKFRATWIVDFYYIDDTTTRSTLDLFPHWISIYVDAETSQAWEYKPYKKPSPQEKRAARKEKRQAKKNKNLD